MLDKILKNGDLLFVCTNDEITLCGMMRLRFLYFKCNKNNDKVKEIVFKLFVSKILKMPRTKRYNICQSFKGTQRVSTREWYTENFKPQIPLQTNTILLQPTIAHNHYVLIIHT